MALAQKKKKTSAAKKSKTSAKKRVGSAQSGDVNSPSKKSTKKSAKKSAGKSAPASKKSSSVYAKESAKAQNKTPKREGELNFTEDFSTSEGMPQLKTAGEINLTFPRFENEKQMDQTEICLKCHGCCMYITVPLEYPRSNDQRDLYTWYLLHRNVEIYIDHDKTWAIIFKTPCDKLLANGMCSIYETRPQLCRDYSPDGCSRVGKDHLYLFQTPAEMNAYLDRNKKKSSKKKAAKR
ncbi:MAG: YkgJ family cysteine cluster protein [Leptospiraceae bacterium]